MTKCSNQVSLLNDKRGKEKEPKTKLGRVITEVPDPLDLAEEDRISYKLNNSGNIPTLFNQPC